MHPIIGKKIRPKLAKLCGNGMKRDKLGEYGEGGGASAEPLLAM